MKIKKKHLAEILASLCKFNSACTLTYCEIGACPLRPGDETCSDVNAARWLEVELPDKEDDKSKQLLSSELHLQKVRNSPLHRLGLSTLGKIYIA